MGDVVAQRLLLLRNWGCRVAPMPRPRPERVGPARTDPAVRVLAALADVDDRTALAWLTGARVSLESEARLLAALPRARAALPDAAAVYDAAPAAPAVP